MRILVVLVIMVVLGVGGYLGTTRTDLVKLHEIIISGAGHATEQRIRASLKTKVGDAFWKIPIREDLERVKADRWVESAEIHRALPRSLVIQVVEKAPAAVVSDEVGKFSYLDEKNDVIDEADVKDIARFPIIVGMNTPQKVKLRDRALALLRGLPDHGIISKEDVSDVHYSDDHGFDLILSHSGILVDIGKENLSLHLDRARRVAEYLDQNHINASRIDSDYAKKVLVKVRKGR